MEYSDPRKISQPLSNTLYLILRKTCIFKNAKASLLKIEWEQSYRGGGGAHYKGKIVEKS